MKKVNTIQLRKMLIALLLVGATHIAMGSFTGSSKDSKAIYSLQSFNKTFYKSASLYSLRAGFQYKGTQVISQERDANGIVTYNSMMRFERGNTTYIYPYKHQVVVPKFKVPTPSSIR